jgi:DNA-directed RNA polymerase specialized sigma24 family protein
VSTAYKEVVELNLPSHLEEHVTALEEAWGLKPRRRRKERLVRPAISARPTPVSAPKPPLWTPCRHWGGIRECECCRSKTQTGNMREAQALFEQYERYVTGVLLKTLKLPFVNKAEHPYFSEIEQKVWMKVAEKIGDFAFQGTPQLMTWLSTLVSNVVIDHRKLIFNGKRDIRQTVALPQDQDHGIPDPQSEFIPAKPTPTANVRNRFLEPEDMTRLRQDMLVYKFRHRDQA